MSIDRYVGNPAAEARDIHAGFADLFLAARTRTGGAMEPAELQAGYDALAAQATDYNKYRATTGTRIDLELKKTALERALAALTQGDEAHPQQP